MAENRRSWLAARWRAVAVPKVPQDLPKMDLSAITRPLVARLLGLPWRRHLLNQQTLVFRAIFGERSAIAVCQPYQES
jgi:hypothetical protein